MTNQLVRSLDAAAEVQRLLNGVMEQVRARWPLDPMIVNLDGYHLRAASKSVR